MRQYGKHKSYKDYQRESLTKALNNLNKHEPGSERYLIIKDHIARIQFSMNNLGMRDNEYKKININYTFRDTDVI